MRFFKLTENPAYKQKFPRLFHVPSVPLHNGKKQNKDKNKNKRVAVFYIFLIPLSSAEKQDKNKK